MKVFLGVIAIVLGLFTQQSLYGQESPSSLNGAGIFKFNDELNGIFHDILTLKLKQATLRLNQVKGKNAFNLIPRYLEDYIEFYYAFIDGKPKDIYGKFMDHKEERLAWFKQGGEGE